MQDELLIRGVDAVLPSSEGLAKLIEGKKIRLYLGIDPTGNQLHLGHAVVLRKLNQFAQAGHHVTLLIGNGTVKIGDPTGKDKTRPLLTDEVIEENFQTWKEQASTILDFSKIELRRNGEWFDAMSFGELIRLFSEMTVQQLMERDMFQERVKAGLPIHAHEILYPILQGYDSVVLDVDLELGGSDQLFNMMVGRQMQQQMKGREKFVLTVPLLTGSDGRKMGKSLGNFISLTEAPEDMYGKLMSVVDEVFLTYFELLTDLPTAEIEEMRSQMAAGANPMPFKKRLAFMLTELFHGSQEAQDAQAHFEKTVQNRELPETMPSLMVLSELPLLDLVMQSGVPTSRSEARRLIEQGGVSLEGEKLVNPAQVVTPQVGQVLRVGKRQYFRLTV
jgi:tyrosyl-tRNA synthetase